MKLIIAVVSNDDSHSLSNALTKENFVVTKFGTEDDRVEKCIEIIKEESKQRTELVPSTASYDIGRFATFPVEVQVGGATIFVVDVEKFIKF